MTDLRTAAQQALEALNVAGSCLDGYYIPRGKRTLPEIEEAIAALRAALASTPEPATPEDMKVYDAMARNYTESKPEPAIDTSGELYQADIVKRLRKAAARKWQGNEPAQRHGMFAQAADEIERLRVEVEHLRKTNSGRPSAELYEAHTAELRAEVEALREANERFGKRQAWWTETMFTLEQERDRLREDAERYRWLRDVAARGDWEHIGNTTDATSTDVRIDECMAAYKAVADIRKARHE